MQANILIDSDGKARLVDFVLSTIKAEFEGTSFYSPTAGGALRWRALELFLEDDVAPTLTAACDIYSYGSVTLQVDAMMFQPTIPSHELSQSPPSRLSSPVITEVQRTSIPLLFPAPRYDSSLHLRQQDPIQSGIFRRRPTTPRDNLYQPHDLTGQIIRDDKYLSAFGGYGDVLVGNWENGSEIHKVRIFKMH
jgi:serine/threonine protein kinase